MATLLPARLIGADAAVGSLEAGKRRGRHRPRPRPPCPAHHGRWTAWCTIHRTSSWSGNREAWRELLRQPHTPPLPRPGPPGDRGRRVHLRRPHLQRGGPPLLPWRRGGDGGVDAQRQALEAHLDPWGVGGVFGGEAFSDFLLHHRDDWQVRADGASVPSACLRSPRFQAFVRTWVDAAVALGADVLFWDEPHLAIPDEDSPPPGSLTCWCDVCLRGVPRRVRRADAHATSRPTSSPSATTASCASSRPCASTPPGRGSATPSASTRSTTPSAA